MKGEQIKGWVGVIEIGQIKVKESSVKIIKVANCLKCPYFEEFSAWAQPGRFYTCKLRGQVTKTLPESIPEDCPLDNNEEG